MEKGNSRVFYRTDTAVRTGDEFYQIAWEHFPELKEKCFRVEVFHGFAGDLPERPESTEDFDTKQAVNNKLKAIEADIKGRGFRRHSVTMHGDGPFAVKNRASKKETRA
jgi:hypothetical protein